MARARKLGPYQLGSIDPGNDKQARKCYVSYWRDSGLVLLEKINHLDFAKGLGHACEACALEAPIVYERGDDPAPPNTIVKINLAGGLLAGALSGGNVTTYEPKQWKGNAAKPPHHLAIWEELTPAERSLFPSPQGFDSVLDYINIGIDLNAPRYYKKPLRRYDAEVTNWLDSTGIGLVYLGRMPRP